MSLIKLPQERKIGTTLYKVRPLGAKKGCQVFARLTRLLGSAAGKSDVKAETFILSALGSIQDDDLEFFTTTFAAYTEIQTDEEPNKSPVLTGVFEFHFSANYAEMMHWLMFCLEVNFKSFFDLAKDTMAGKPGTSVLPVA